MEKYKIIAKEWRSGIGTVGFIAYQTFEDQWCAAVGYSQTAAVVSGINAALGFDIVPDEDDDAQHIAGWGAQLSWQEAQAFFPYLDITKYKYYEGKPDKVADPRTV